MIHNKLHQIGDGHTDQRCPQYWSRRVTPVPPLGRHQTAELIDNPRPNVAVPLAVSHLR